ncbi:MAG: hypothetical protein WB561_06295 [Terracidiphilus sp.]
MRAFQVFVRPGQNIYRRPLHAGSYSMVLYADELDARTDLGLNTLYEQVEQRPIPHVLHHQAARLYPRLNAAFSTDLLWLFRRFRKPERGRSEHTCHRCNCQQAHSPSPFYQIRGAMVLRAQHTPLLSDPSNRGRERTLRDGQSSCIAMANLHVFRRQC